MNHERTGAELRNPIGMSKRRKEPLEFDTGLRPKELDPDRPVPFDTPWGSYALYTVEGEVIASQSFCPHMQGPLFQGTQSGREITCPWHRWRFSLEDGRCTARDDGAPEDVENLLFREVRIGERGTFILGAPSEPPETA
jgi:nitrite reductase/ring-hydroxylating ferredoxin subunit